MIIRESKSGLLNPFPFLVWSSVALALAWFWGDELVRVHGWAMNKWFMGLPYLVRLIVRQAHWAFYLGFGLLFVVELCRGRKKTAGAALLYLLANLLVGVLLAKFLKTSLGRPRPFMETHGALSWQPFSSDTHFESLPSGHTTDAWVGLGVIHRLYSPAWVRGTSLAVALLVGVSRVALGKHYPSDVILGLILGYLGGYGLAHLWRRGGFKPVIKICVRAAAGAALIGLAAWAASSAQAPAVQWSRAHGGTGAASPLLLPGQSLGQPLELPRPPALLSHPALRHLSGKGRRPGGAAPPEGAGSAPGGNGTEPPLSGPQGLPGGTAGGQRAFPLGPAAPTAESGTGAIPGGLPGTPVRRISAPLGLAGFFPGLAGRFGPDSVYPGAGAAGSSPGPGPHLPGTGLRPPSLPPGLLAGDPPGAADVLADSAGNHGSGPGPALAGTAETGCGHHSGSGIRTVKVLPSPGREATSTRPPRFSTVALTMARPRPVPVM